MGGIMQLGIIVTMRDLMSRGMTAAKARVKGLEGGLKDLTAAGMRWIKVGGMIAMSGALIMAAFAGPTMAAAKFQHRMAEVSTMVDTATVDMGRLNKGVLGLSQTFGQVPDNMGNALYNVLSAGIPAAGALNTLKLASKAAISGVTDVNTAATVGVNVLNAYRLPVSQLSRVYDVLFMTVKKGVTTFPELAQYLGEVTSIASTAHVSIEQVGAAVAGLTSAGIKTPQAMTALRGMLQAIAAPTKRNKKAIEDLGGAQLQAAVKTGNLVRMLEILGSKVHSLADIRQLVPNVEGAKGLAALTNNMDKFHATIAAMKGSAGSMEEAYKKMSASPIQKFNKLKSSLSVLKVTIGNQLVPAFKSMLANLTPIIQGITKWINAHPKLTAGIIKTVAALGAMLTVLGTLMVVVGVWKLALVFLPIALKATAGALLGAAGAALKFTLALLTNPITWIVAGVVALGVGLYFLVTRWKQVKAAATGALESMRVKLKKVPDWLLAALPGIGMVALAFKHWDKIGPYVAGALNAIPGLFDKLVAWVTNRAVDLQAALLAPVNWARKKLGMKPIQIPVHVKASDIRGARLDLLAMWKEGAGILAGKAKAVAGGVKQTVSGAVAGLGDLVTGTRAALDKIAGMNSGNKAVSPIANWRAALRKVEAMGRGVVISRSGHVVQNSMNLATAPGLNAGPRMTGTTLKKQTEKTLSFSQTARMETIDRKETTGKTVQMGPVTVQVNGAQDPEATGRAVVKQLQLVAEMG